MPSSCHPPLLISREDLAREPSTRARPTGRAAANPTKSHHVSVGFSFSNTSS
jgi:hypothetical protein